MVGPVKCGCHGLGLNPVTIAETVGTMPSVSAISIPLFGSVGAAVPYIGPLLAAISIGIGRIGRGRTEADSIGPAQSAALDAAWDIARSVGLNRGGGGTIPASVTTETLRHSLDAITQTGAEFLGYLRDGSLWTDGRASGQSASDVMPAIDGTSGYGRFASGGSPVTGPHPNPEWTWHDPISPGGITGAIAGELARRRAAGNIFDDGPGEVLSAGGDSLASVLIVGGLIFGFMRR